MATNIVTIGQKYGLPPFSEEIDFDHWLHEMEMWKLVTDLAKSKQGPVLYLSLSSKIKLSCASLTTEVLSKDDGIDKLTEKLRELYGVSEDQATFNSYEQFETFQRPSSMSITDFINQFEQLNQKLISHKIQLPDAVLAYQLLKNANLPKEKRDLARATISELTFKAMKKQIKAIYDLCTTKSNDSEDTSDIQVDSENPTFYGFNYRPRRYNRNNNRGNRGRGRGNRYIKLHVQRMHQMRMVTRPNA